MLLCSLSKTNTTLPCSLMTHGDDSWVYRYDPQRKK
jgi:hypothetical protein